LLLVEGGGLLAGFGGLFGLLLGAALAVPWAVRWMAGAAARPAGWIAGTPGRMAARGVVAGLSRSGVAATALVIAVAAVIGVSVMIDSFRAGLVDWLDATLTADVYVQAPGPSGQPPPPLDPALAERLAGVEGVTAVGTIRHLRIPAEGGEIRLRAYDRSGIGELGMPYKERGAEAWVRFQRGEAVYVTEPFAAHRDLAVGDTLTLTTPAGEQRRPIAAVVKDYTSSEGAVVVSRAFYDAYWADERVTGIAVYLADGASPAARIEALRAAAGALGEGVRMRSNAEIRQRSLAIFERTFAVTRVLRLLAAVIAAAGVFGALLALALERAREVAVLRALGLTPAQVWGLELGRTGLLGLLAGLLAVPPGLAVAAALTGVINERAFGWSLALELDPLLLGQAVALATAAALLAGLYPAWRSARISPAEALRDEA
ncbi:FtsX-like permease family protein, partial [Halorhodospira neutriphila]